MNDKCYTLVVKSPHAARKWFVAFDDKIEGLSFVYKTNLIDVEGDFTLFMEDLVLSTRIKKPTWQRCAYWLVLWLSRDVETIETVAPFQSQLARHSIQRDKDAVAYHYDVSNAFFEMFLARNMLYTSGLWNDRSIDLDEACRRKYQKALDDCHVTVTSKCLDVGCGWGGLVEMGRAAGYNIRGITISQQQVAYHPERQADGSIQYLHYKELDDAEKFDVIFAFQCTEHMPRDELSRFCQKMESLLTPDGILLVEFMTTVKEVKCHPFMDKFIFPDGAQFPLATAIAVFEQNRRLRLQSIHCLDGDYTRTITEWNKRLNHNQERCVELLGGNREKYRSFALYLKWAEFLYRTGRSRCYTCMWRKVVE
jgi:cyclopropane-fatty-acyl-phospholipid synthase